MKIAIRSKKKRKYFLITTEWCGNCVNHLSVRFMPYRCKWPRIIGNQLLIELQTSFSHGTTSIYIHPLRILHGQWIYSEHLARLARRLQWVPGIWYREEDIPDQYGGGIYVWYRFWPFCAGNEMM